MASRSSRARAARRYILAGFLAASLVLTAAAAADGDEALVGQSPESAEVDDGDTVGSGDARRQIGGGRPVPPPCVIGTIDNTVAPTISPSGSQPHGTGFSTTNGSWAPCQTTVDYYQYQWKRNGSPIGGATGTTYTSGGSDISTVIRSSVRACSNEYGCSASVDSSNSATITNSAPVQPTEEAFPVGERTTSTTGPFRIKYSDPNGDAGQLRFDVYNLSNQLVQTKAQTGIPSGGFPNVYLDGALGPGSYYWTATPTDVWGFVGATSGQYGFSVSALPAVPQLESPSAGAAITTSTPVLRASTTDADDDPVGFVFVVATDSACANPLSGAGSPLLASARNAANRWEATWKVPEGKLNDTTTYYWCAKAQDLSVTNGVSETALSAGRALSVQVPKLGLSEYWPLWRRGPIAVNQATGNLVLSLPGTSYATGSGELGVSLAYNSLDARPATPGLPPGWTLGLGAEPPAKLVDHTNLSGNERYDAVERIEPDGSASYYARVGSSTTYVPPAGDTSVLSRKPTGGFLLVDPDGSLYEFDAPAADGVAPLRRAELASASWGKGRIEWLYAGGKPQSITAYGKNEAGVEQTLATMTFNWACGDALVCVTGPDDRVWKYKGDATGGTSGNLYELHNGTRTVTRISWTSGRPTAIRNANDLDPDSASLDYSGSTGNPGDHRLAITYTSGKVTSVTEWDVRDRYYTPSRPDPQWTFAYYAGVCPGSSLPAPQASHTAPQPTLSGCTELVTPRHQAAQKKRLVFHDSSGHPLALRDTLGNTTLLAYNARHQLEWTEDAAGAPTDYTYDPWDFSLTKVEAPDPDGVGGLVRPTTSYRYDETRAGTYDTPGPALDGLRAAYYDNADLSGRPKVLQRDGSIDFDWLAGGPSALGGQSDTFSIR